MWKLHDIAEDATCLFDETLLLMEWMYDILGIWEPVLEMQTVHTALRTMSITGLIVQRV